MCVGSVAAAAAVLTAYPEKSYVPVHLERALPHQVLKQRNRSPITALQQTNSLDKENKKKRTKDATSTRENTSYISKEYCSNIIANRESSRWRDFADPKKRFLFGEHVTLFCAKMVSWSRWKRLPAEGLQSSPTPSRCR